VKTKAQQSFQTLSGCEKHTVYNWLTKSKAVRMYSQMKRLQLLFPAGDLLPSLIISFT